MEIITVNFKSIYVIILAINKGRGNYETIFTIFRIA